MKHLFFILFVLCSLVSCNNSSTQKENPDDLSKGSGIHDEVGDAESGDGSGGPGEEGSGVWGIGTGAEDSIADTTNNK